MNTGAANLKLPASGPGEEVAAGFPESSRDGGPGSGPPLVTVTLDAPAGTRSTETPETRPSPLSSAVAALAQCSQGDCPRIVWAAMPGPRRR